MGEHYTRATEEVTAYCNCCRRPTRHAVSNGRRGHCLEHERENAYTQDQIRRMRSQLEEECRGPDLFNRREE